MVKADDVQPYHAEELSPAAQGRLGRRLVLLAAAGRREVDGIAAGKRPGRGGRFRCVRAALALVK